MPRDGSHAQNAPELGDDNHNIIHGAGKEPTVSLPFHLSRSTLVRESIPEEYPC